MAQADLRRGVFDEVRQIRIKETVEEVLEDLSDHVDPSQASVTPKGTDVAALKLNGSANPRPDPAPKIETENSQSLELGSESQTSVLCVSGGSFLDEAAATIFARILGSYGIASTVEP